MEPNETPIIDDEATLDKELADSINAVRAGNTLEVTPPKTDEPETPAGEEGTPAQETSTPAAEKPEGDDPFRVPNKGKFESDEAYEKRVELFDLVKRRKAADTPEAKAKLSEDIKAAKSQLKNLNGTERFNNNKTGEGNTGEKDPLLAADQERLKQLGGATKEDIAAFVQQERQQQEVQTTLTKFVDRTPELKDEDMREVFFDFVDENYVWQGKSGKELLQVLEMARENMFKPSESIQERVLKGANVAEKVNAMQFPGGTSGRAEFSPEMKQSIKELTDTGMSEDKAIALLSD